MIVHLGTEIKTTFGVVDNGNLVKQVAVNPILLQKIDELRTV